jgi:ATP-dependent helicase/nuclease subunit A
MTGLADQAVRDRTAGRGPAGLAETLFVEAGAGSGKTRALVDRVEALVDAGVELRHIAAITFTEKAAAELRQRIRTRLVDRASAATGEEARTWQRAVEQIDIAAIGTLHAFAQRILADRPLEAGLPPSIRVLDEVASLVAFQDRWQVLRHRLLDDPNLDRAVDLGLAAGMQLEDLRELARAFDANWDLVAERVDPDAPEPEAVDAAELLAELDRLAATITGCHDPGRRLLNMRGQIEDYAARLRAAADERERLALLRADKPTFKPGKVPARPDASGTDLEQLGTEVKALADLRARTLTDVLDQCLARLAAAIACETLAAVDERRTGGRLEFHDLLVLARQLLRGPNGTSVREALREKYRRLLLDEFQDTDPIQIELAALLAARPGDDHGTPWEDLPVDPGRLFFVGDPKQSIYRFRRADISLFLQARQRFGDPPAKLSTNFRTSPTVLEWVNHVFGRLIEPEPGAQPAYSPLAPAPNRVDAPVGPAVSLLGADPHDDDASADDVRAAEAADVAATITTALAEGWTVRTAEGGWRPARPGDIAVLLPARTSLPALEEALEQHGIPYRAETSALVYQTPEIRELLAAARAIADPSDALSLVTALRSSLFGCGDDDLLVYRKRYGADLDVLADPPSHVPSGDPVRAALRYLRGLHDRLAWLTPSEVLDALVRDRRVLEVGLAHGRPRDLWRRIRFLLDQARAWSESEGGTLRAYLAWAALQGSDSARAAEPILPETDDDAVRVLTVHAAKGLEFPITIVSGLTSRPGGRRQRVEVGWPPAGGVALKLGKGFTNPEFERYQPIDEQLGHHERVRLLYVACTRAEDHLVVSLHRARSQPPDDRSKRTLAELLADGCLHAQPQAPGQTVTEPATHPLVGRPADEALPLTALDAWRARRATALRSASTPQVVAATSVAGLEIDGDDPGLAKEPRDLELPPWLKGRYGTGIGRAVHAVLQSVDLTTGEGLEASAAAQAMAEGVADRASDIAGLARAALASDVVREAATRPAWRETYVAAEIGGTTIEGYVDLLYRTAEGLVVVDYKTAGDARDLDVRVRAYRLQAASYALAVAEATGLAVVRCVLCFLTPEGAAEREIDDLDAAISEVRQALTATADMGAAGA